MWLHADGGNRHFIHFFFSLFLPPLLWCNQHSTITCLIVADSLYSLCGSFSGLSQKKQFSVRRLTDLTPVLRCLGDWSISSTPFPIVHALTIGYSSICGLILCLAANWSILLLTWRLATREPANFSWCARKGPPCKVSGFSVTPTRMNVPLGFNKERYWSQGNSPLTVLIMKSSFSSFSIFSSVNSLLFQNSCAPKDFASSVLLCRGHN